MMKLSDIHSQELLPRFAALIVWICHAFDVLIKRVTSRSKAIDAPLTMEAIEALTDEELQAYYTQYGLAEYYPDLSRDLRNWMLYQMARMWQTLGTPKAVEVLCQYIFDDMDLHLTITDNMAFNESGQLVNSNLFDLFDVTVNPSSENLPSNAINRIYDNVFKFSRNSQTIRNLSILTPDNDLNVTAYSTLPYDGVFGVLNFQNDDICEVVPIPPDPKTYPSFALLDSETGEVLHTSSTAHLGFIVFTELHKIASIAHLGFTPFTELYRLPNDTVRFIDFPPPEAIIGYMWHDSTVSLLANNSDYLYIYESDGTTPRAYDSNKTYTLVHVLVSQDVYADEYLDQLYISGQYGYLELRAPPGTYSTLSFWRVEYTEE